MKKVFSVLVVLILCAGCAQTQPVLSSGNAFYSFTDSAGCVVSLPAAPQKTAVLFSSFAQIWTLCGGEIALTVGESAERGFVGDDAVFVDAGAGKSINEELLLAAECDFVIGSADIPAQVQAVQLLRQNGVACALLRVEDFEDYLSVLRIFSDINRNPAAYEEYGTAAEAEIEKIFTALPTDMKKPRILFVRSGASYSSAKAKTAETHFAAAMLKELGTENIAETAGILTENLSTEEILMQDPDYIFIVTMGDEEAAKEYMQSILYGEVLQNLRAVRNGNVIFLPKELFQYKPNHRWAQAYAYLADVLRDGYDAS